MERLTAADAWFLYLESPTIPLHVTGLLLLDPSTAPHALSFDSFRTHVAGRLDLMPMLRRRLVEVPLEIDHPSWVEDLQFDIDRHVVRHVLPGRGSAADLAEFVGEFAEVPLDRSRPLWEIAVIERVDDGNFAMVMKVHHCIVDGITGMEILAGLVDLTPTPRTGHSVSEWEPEPAPGAAFAFVSAAWHRVTTPLRSARAAAGITSSVAQLASTAVRRRVAGARAVAHPLNAPRTCLNATLTARRSVAFDRMPLEDLKEVRRAFGVTVNDVVLAACTAGLRRYLEMYDRVPDRALVCSVPVSTHGHDTSDRSANQVSNMFVDLPVHLADPVEQLRTVHAGSTGAKELHESVGANMIGDVVDLAPPSVFRLAARMYSRAGLADRLPPVHNLIVSNVIGSTVPLYCAGAQVVGIFPFGPLMEGAGLNITVVSNDDEMYIGLIACPDLVSHLDELLAEVRRGVAVLLEAAGGGRPRRRRRS